MSWLQRPLKLSAQPRGVHLIHEEICAQLPEISDYRVGLLHLFMQHTSASLAINENADPDVRGDMERWFRHNIRDNEPYYVHTYEGPDDMPAHIKSVLVGPSLSIPIGQGRLQLGTWQGIYLCEHREHGGSRRVIATLQGE